MSEKWRNENWFTSSWNFAEEVRSSLHFSDHIKIHDVTLRDGEQQAGLIFDYKQKIALAEKLSEMGIHRIEAGMPAVSAQDRQVIVDLAKRSDIKSEIFAFARCMVDDVKRAADCGVKGVVIEIPCNEEMITKAYGWTMERALELSIQASLAAKEAGLYTVFFPIDMTRASMKWSLDLLEHVADNGHMDALAIVDTMGVLAPHTVPYLVKAVKARIPGKPVELHFHDDYGLGAAVWTRDINRAIRMSRALQAGTVWVNEYLDSSYGNPFGGYKQSGIGREVHKMAMEHYSQVKNICIADTDDAPLIW